MNDNQRWVLIVALSVMAAIMSASFLHFGQGIPMVHAEILRFSDDPLGDGIYGNAGESLGEAVAAGVIAPVLLLAIAAYIFFGMRGRISN